MTISPVGYYASEARVYDLNPFAGGASVPAADGDWIFWFLYYPNTETVTFADLTGWTQIRKTIGSVGTIELWRYHWATGNPTAWVINKTGRDFTNPEMGFVLVFRDLVATPGPVSTTTEAFSSPILVGSITDASIGDNDLAVVFCASNNGTTLVPPAGSENSLNAGYPNETAAFWWRTGTAGSASSRSISVTGGTPTEALGLQIILPDVPLVPLGGWGVGMVRMGAN